MNLPIAAGVWAAIVAFVAILGLHLGYGNWRFALALGVAAVLFTFELFLAAPDFLAEARQALGEHGGVLAPLIPLFAVLIYTIGVTASGKAALIGAAYVIVSSLIAATGASKPAGTCTDYAAAMIVWLPVEFRWMYRMFPYPPQLTHTLTILLALSTGVAAFVLLRRLEGIGYAVDWKRGFGWNVILHFSIFAVIAVSIGIPIGFLRFGPSAARLRSLPLTVIGILFFTAWPEEFLFRGVLQNLLSRTLKNEWTGLILASVIFGLSHVFHAPYPNWKYVGLATIAGVFYGHTWMKTRSLFPAAIVHALVDILWHVLFR
jgi:uncharacterized protein